MRPPYQLSDESIYQEQFEEMDQWPLLKYVILHHPNLVTRHEACFIAGSLKNDEFIDTLIEAICTDSSIVVRHEAIEALGRIEPTDSAYVQAFFDTVRRNQSNDHLWAHPDILGTLDVAERRLKRKVVR